MIVHAHTHTHTEFVTWVGDRASRVAKEYVCTERVIHLKLVGRDWNSIAHHWVIEVRSGQRAKGSDDTIAVVAVPDSLFLRKPGMKLNLVDHRLYRQTIPCAWLRYLGVNFLTPTNWRRCVLVVAVEAGQVIQCKRTAKELLKMVDAKVAHANRAAFPRPICIL